MHIFHATYSIEKDQATVKNLVLFPGQYQTTTSNENLHSGCSCIEKECEIFNKNNLG